MISDGKLSSRPPQIGGHGSDALEAFIGGASVHTPEPDRRYCGQPGNPSHRHKPR